MSDNKQSDVAMNTALPPAPPLTVSGTSSGEEGRGASDIEATSSGGRGSNSPKKMAKWRRMAVKAAAERAKAESGESATTPAGETESMLIMMLNEKMKELKDTQHQLGDTQHQLSNANLGFASLKAQLEKKELEANLEIASLKAQLKEKELEAEQQDSAAILMQKVDSNLEVRRWCGA